MDGLPPNPNFGYSLVLSEVLVDFLSSYKLQPGAVYESHGPVTGPMSPWIRSSPDQVGILRVLVGESELPTDVKALAEQLLASAVHSTDIAGH